MFWIYDWLSQAEGHGVDVVSYHGLLNEFIKSGSFREPVMRIPIIWSESIERHTGGSVHFWGLMHGIKSIGLQA